MAAFAQGAAAFGGIDVLFNNAGICAGDDSGPVETPLSVWDQTIATNLTSVFLCCKAGIPYLLEAGGGVIINNASIVALVGSAFPQIAYTAAKGGVLSMTRELAVMYARKKIRAVAVCPGPVATPLVQAFMADEEAWALRRRYMPMGRLASRKKSPTSWRFWPPTKQATSTAPPIPSMAASPPPMSSTIDNRI